MVNYLEVELVQVGQELGDGTDALVRHVDAVLQKVRYQFTSCPPMRGQQQTLSQSEASLHLVRKSEASSRLVSQSEASSHLVSKSEASYHLITTTSEASLNLVSQ